MSQHVFKLFIMGSSDRSQRAVENLRQLCEAEIPNQYEIHVIDVLLDPAAAELEKIFATPTLVKHEPPPRTRIIGDLGERERVLKMLSLKTTKEVGSR